MVQRWALTQTQLKVQAFPPFAVYKCLVWWTPPINSNLAKGGNTCCFNRRSWTLEIRSFLFLGTHHSVLIYHKLLNGTWKVGFTFDPNVSVVSYYGFISENCWFPNPHSFNEERTWRWCRTLVLCSLIHLAFNEKVWPQWL